MTHPEESSGRPTHVLVTGATGLVGNNVVRYLLEQGTSVRVVIRPTANRRPINGLDVEVVEGDITDLESIHRAVRGVDAVVHAAGCVLLGWRNEHLHDQINRLGTLNVARAARMAEARLVFVSSINALGYGTPDQPADEDFVAGQNIPCPYVTSKQAAEAAVRAEIDQGLQAMIVYPGFVLGPWDWKPSSGRMLLEVARGFVPFAPVGGFSVGDARDVAHGIYNALARFTSGRRYVLAGNNVSYLEAWRHFAQVVGRRGPYCRSGPLMRAAAGRLGDLWGRISHSEPDVNSAAVKLSNQWHVFSSARAQRELDYQIRPMDESIHDSWQWLNQNGYVR